MTDPAPIILTNPNQLPPFSLKWFTAATFADALAEYERKYGKAKACWQYGAYFYFEGVK